MLLSLRLPCHLIFPSVRSCKVQVKFEDVAVERNPANELFTHEEANIPSAGTAKAFPLTPVIASATHQQPWSRDYYKDNKRPDKIRIGSLLILGS